jgi:hypothetical protein
LRPSRSVIFRLGRPIAHRPDKGPTSGVPPSAETTVQLLAFSTDKRMRFNTKLLVSERIRSVLGAGKSQAIFRQLRRNPGFDSSATYFSVFLQVADRAQALELLSWHYAPRQPAPLIQSLAFGGLTSRCRFSARRDFLHAASRDCAELRSATSKRIGCLKLGISGIIYSTSLC